MIRIIVISILMSFVAISSGQNEALPGDEVEVIKDFNARLADANKLKILPQSPKPDTSQGAYRNIILSQRPTNIVYDPPFLRPLAMPVSDGQPVRNNYIMAGLGYPNNIMAGAGINTKIDDAFSLGITGGYETIEDQSNPFRAATDWGFQVDGKYLIDRELMFRGNFGYQNEDRYLYGFDPFPGDSLLVDEDLLKRYKLFNMDLNLSNHTENEYGINYEVGLDFQRIADNLNTKETNTKFYGSASKNTSDRSRLGLAIRTDFTTLNDTSRRSLNFFTLSPRYEFYGTSFNMTAGANVQVNAGEFSVFPTLEVTYPVPDASLIAYLEIEGGLVKNHYLSATRYNPFTNSVLDSINVSREFGGTIGIRGKLGNLRFDGAVGFKDVKAMATYIQDPLDTLTFQMIYDDASVVTVAGSAQYQLQNGISLLVDLKGRFISMDNLEKPWHIPQFDGSFTASYDLRKFTFTGMFHGQSAPFVPDPESGSRKLDVLVDISGHVRYKLSDVFTLFVEANNLTNQRRERWQDYEFLGFNGLVGAVAHF